MRLYLIRHGETAFNAEGRIQGRSEVPLSEVGRRQSEITAEYLVDQGIEAIYASPLERARQTAGILSRRLQTPLTFLDDLMELDVGIFRGLLWSECQQKFPDAVAAWKAQDPDYSIPQGESRRDVMVRGRRAIDWITGRGHRTAAVVGHGGTLAGAIKSLLQIPAGVNPLALANCSITELSWTSRLLVLRLNDTSHLNGFSVEKAESPELAGPLDDPLTRSINP